MNQNDIDKKRKRTELLVKGGILCVAAFFFAPIAATVIQGLAGLIVVTIIGCGSVFVAPLIAQRAGNFRLKLIKAEAAKNPMETLQNDLREKTIALDNRKTAIKTLDAKIRTFSDKVDGLKDRFGAQDSAYIKMSHDLIDLRRVLTSSSDKWNEAQRQLGLYSNEVDRAGMIWDAAQAAAAAQESSGLTEGEFYAKLKSETAFTSIQDNYNSALASLDTTLDDGKTPASITNTPAVGVADAEIVSEKSTVDAPPLKKHKLA